MVLGATPLLFFVHSRWVHAALLAYVLTAIFLGIALAGDFPPFGSRWFWKATVLMVIVHTAVLVGLVWLDLRFPTLNRTPRVFYGFVGAICLLEGKLCQYIIDMFDPHPMEDDVEPDAPFAGAK